MTRLVIVLAAANSTPFNIRWSVMILVVISRRENARAFMYTMRLSVGVNGS